MAVSQRQLHFVRHGEVDNPEGILYGRLPGYALSDTGHKMAELAAQELRRRERPIAELYASPLLRAQQSATPIAQAFDLEVQNEPRIIEPTNFFEGKQNRGSNSAFKKPQNWWLFWNPFLPSWGEPYARIRRRVEAAMDEAWNAHDDGDIVMVSHQAPIWNAHLAVAGKMLAHNPAKRRCDLSSITSFVREHGNWTEVGYTSPAAELIEISKDVGAV